MNYLRAGFQTRFVIARRRTKRSLRDEGNEPSSCHGEALCAVAIQLDHHARPAGLVMTNRCSLAGALRAVAIQLDCFVAARRRFSQ